METVDDFNRPNLTQEEIENKNKKHRFHTLYSHDPKTDEIIEESKADQLMDQFQWDSEDSESEESLITTPENIQQCAIAVVDYVAANIEKGDINATETGGIEITLLIPLTVDPLLEERFNEKWSIESRAEQIDKVKDAIDALVLQAEIKQKLDTSLTKIIPPAQAVWEVVFVSLDDDDVTVDSGIVGQSGFAPEKTPKSFTTSIHVCKKHA